MTYAHFFRRLTLLLMFLSTSFPGADASAETIELVTYYPSPGGQEVDTPRLHARAGTIGPAPYSLTNPAVLPDGTLLVWDRLGVGTGLNLPAGPLHVVGLDDVPERVLFLPGVDTGAAGTPDLRVGIGTDAPQVRFEISGPGGEMMRLTDEADGRFLRIGGDADGFFLEPRETGSIRLNGNNVLGLTVAGNGGVAIGALNPAASAILDLSSTTRGFLPPRMTTAERNAIVAPAAGLTIYNTTTEQLNTFNGANWNPRSGTVMQVVSIEAGDGETLAPPEGPGHSTWQALGGTIPITPRSGSSKLIVEANFGGYVRDNDTTGSNSSADFRLREVTPPAADIGAGGLRLSASSDNSSPNGIACQAPCLVRAIVANGGVATRSFQLWGKANTIGATNVNAKASNVVLTVTEIQN